MNIHFYFHTKQTVQWHDECLYAYVIKNVYRNRKIYINNNIIIYVAVVTFVLRHLLFRTNRRQCCFAISYTRLSVNHRGKKIDWSTQCSFTVALSTQDSRYYQLFSYHEKTCICLSDFDDRDLLQRFMNSFKDHNREIIFISTAQTGR